MPAAEDLWDADFSTAAWQTSRTAAASQNAVAELLEQPGGSNRRKRSTASGPAAGRKGADKRSRVAVRGQLGRGKAARIGPCASKFILR